MLVSILIALLVFGLLYIVLKYAPFGAPVKEAGVWVLLVLFVIYVISLLTGHGPRLL